MGKNYTYYLCNDKNQKIIQFQMMFFPLDFVILETNVLEPSLIPDFFQLNRLEEFLELYLKSLIPDKGRGWELDDYIVNTLHLSKKS